MGQVRINIFDELKKEREEKEYYKRKADEWQDKYYEILKELKEVKALLRKFLNENTPSSKLPFKINVSYEDRPVKGTNPRGKPKGSNGGTKKFPTKFDRKVHAKVGKKCKRCKRNLIIEEYVKPVYEMKKVEVEVIEAAVEEGYCPNCDELYIGTHPEIPVKGMMGPNLQAFFTELKHNFAGSYEKVSLFFENVSGISFSHSAINDCTGRVAEHLEPSYDKLEETLPKTNYAYSDETGWPVNGMPWWLWLFITANFVFITIQDSRARKVLTSLFGENYMGVIISDCMKAYQKFAKAFQKCWAHLLRKAKYEAKNNPRKNVVKLHAQLLSLHKEMAKFLKKEPSMNLRIKMKERFEKKLQMIINYKYWCPEAQSIVDNWLKQYRNQWLTAITIPGITLDNNINERGIRKVIPTRKLLGGHRTRNGTKKFAIIETHRQTWKLQGKPPYTELTKYLKHYNKNQEPLPILSN